MPFKSRKQEQWMKMNKPKLYKKWKGRYGNFQKRKRNNRKKVK